MWSNISNDVAGSTEVVNDAKHDIWRNSILRYAGYANEAGEAFAPIFPKFLKPSYGISLLYVLGDTCDKSYAAYDEQRKLYPTKVDYKLVYKQGGDVLVWQMLASVILPGLSIKALTKALTYTFRHQSFKKFIKIPLSTKVVSYGPTALSLLAIPFIVGPIDELVDNFMKHKYRPFIDKMFQF